LGHDQVTIVFAFCKKGSGHTFQLFHHQPAADEERCSLMYFGGLYIQYALLAVGCFATGFFNDESEWVAFI
jgi:hypothetical protein